MMLLVVGRALAVQPLRRGPATAFLCTAMIVAQLIVVLTLHQVLLLLQMGDVLILRRLQQMMLTCGLGFGDEMN